MDPPPAPGAPAAGSSAAASSAAGLVPLLHLRRQRARQRLGEGLRHLRAPLPHRRQRIHQLLRGDRHRRVALERRRAGEHLVQHAPHRVQVAPRVHRVAHRLLGAHVHRRADHQPRLLEAPAVARVQRQRDAEVGHQRGALVQHDVLGLDVAVHQPAPVCVVERPDHLPRDLERLGDGEPPFRLEAVAQRGPLDEGHHVVDHPRGLAGVVQGQDVRVGQRGGDLDLVQEPRGPDPLGQLRAERLEGDGPVVPDVLGQEDDGHPPRAEPALDAVAVGQRVAQAVRRVGQAALPGWRSGRTIGTALAGG